MAHIKLKDAYFCVNCETIGSDPNGCVVCLSQAVHPLAKFLNRPELVAHTCADINTEIVPCHACSV